MADEPLELKVKTKLLYEALILPKDVAFVFVNASLSLSLVDPVSDTVADLNFVLSASVNTKALFTITVWLRAVTAVVLPPPANTGGLLTADVFEMVMLVVTGLDRLLEPWPLLT